jgi:integrase
MATKSPLLSDAVDEFVKLRKTWAALNTLRQEERTLRFFLASVGNIKVSSIEARHTDTFFAARSATCAPSTLNVEISVVRRFLEHCRLRQYIAQNPLLGRRRLKTMPRNTLLIPSSEFPRLLDAASHPRDRIVVALGLYLFLRISEIQTLRLVDVHLDRAELDVEIHKTRGRDAMPIGAELDAELRRWLTYYAAEVPLRGEYLLAPAKSAPLFGLMADHRSVVNQGLLKPETQASNIYKIAQRSVGALGYPTRQEGGHTLRRSGARALYDRLAKDGHDGAIRYVQAMLHHASVLMTEGYLGITLDRKKRDDLIKRRAMFPAPAVASLAQAREAREARHG